MKRGILLISIILLNYCCTRSNEENPSPIPNNWTETEIIQDPLFEKGFVLTPLDPKIVQEGGGLENTSPDTLYFYGNGSHPIWQLGQWTSKYNFANSLPEQEQDGSISFTNSGGSKKIALYPDHSLLLEVNASKEYDAPRIGEQPWLHLLIGQDFSNARIRQSERLEFSMELKLEKEENKMTPETFDPSIHTAQSPFYFFIVNQNQNSSDYSQHIWFGIPSYDYRYSELSNIENVLWDIGTSTFIYTVPPRSIWGNIRFQDKKWHKCKCDLQPWIARALEAMKEKGVFLNTTLNDLVITSMNFGWEVPGTFDVAIRVKNISLKMIQ